MKRKLMPYLLSYAFLFVSYLIISFIMAIQFIFHLKDINIHILIKPLFVFIIYYLLYYIKKKQQ